MPILTGDIEKDREAIKEGKELTLENVVSKLFEPEAASRIAKEIKDLRALRIAVRNLLACYDGIMDPDIPLKIPKLWAEIRKLAE